MKYIKRSSLICLFVMFSLSCNQENKSVITAQITNDNLNDKSKIAAMLDSFNLAAAEANFNQYFNYFSEDATYLGTDALEHWDKASFMTWAKPFFDKKTTWDFKSIQRHIYLGENGDYAWFDELLDTPFAKMCRGSGVLVNQNGNWRIQQYVLSMTIPNELSKQIKDMKLSLEDSLMQVLPAPSH